MRTLISVEEFEIVLRDRRCSGKRQYGKQKIAHFRPPYLNKGQYHASKKEIGNQAAFARVQGRATADKSIE